jgi:hypothetical protein
MSYPEHLVIVEGPNGCSIGLVNETTYNPKSADNTVVYDRFYGEQPDNGVNPTSRHGILLLKGGKIERSVCVSATGSGTGIRPDCSVVDGDLFLICCADSIFCLLLPYLDLNWVSKADDATCFGIYQYRNSYIVHGELAISRMDSFGAILWQFSGPDIFTTLNGGGFTLTGDVVEVECWDGSAFNIDAQTGKLVS